MDIVNRAKRIKLSLAVLAKENGFKMGCYMGIASTHIK